MNPILTKRAYQPEGMRQQATYLFRVRDCNRQSLSEEDAAQAAFEYAQFEIELHRHYRAWPAIDASSLRQPGTGALLVRLVSSVSADVVHHSLLALLVHLNQTLPFQVLGKHRFELQEVNDRTPLPGRLQ